MFDLVDIIYAQILKNQPAERLKRSNENWTEDSEKTRWLRTARAARRRAGSGFLTPGEGCAGSPMRTLGYILSHACGLQCPFSLCQDGIGLGDSLACK